MGYAGVSRKAPNDSTENTEVNRLNRPLPALLLTTVMVNEIIFMRLSSRGTDGHMSPPLFLQSALHWLVSESWKAYIVIRHLLS